MTAAQKAYFNIQSHVEYGEDLEPISSRTKKAVIAMIEEKIEAHKTWPINWNYGQGAEMRAYVPTLEKMLAAAQTA